VNHVADAATVVVVVACSSREPVARIGVHDLSAAHAAHGLTVRDVSRCLRAPCIQAPNRCAWAPANMGKGAVCLVVDRVMGIHNDAVRRRKTALKSGLLFWCLIIRRVNQELMLFDERSAEYRAEQLSESI